ncbi:hypothetical protein T484DRAFT_1820840, partial [Baffinella frigidus]
PALPSPQHASVSPSGPTQIGDVVDITCDKASVSPSSPTQIVDVVDITCDKGWDLEGDIASSRWELEGDIASPARCVAYSAKGSYTGEYDPDAKAFREYDPDAKAFSCVQMCDPYEDIEHGSIEPAGKV